MKKVELYVCANYYTVYSGDEQFIAIVAALWLLRWERYLLITILVSFN